MPALVPFFATLSFTSLALLVVGCRPTPAVPPADERIEVRVEDDGERVCFAVIGDYGRAGTAEAAVSALVHGWRPDFIITLGDNNYQWGRARTIDRNIGQYYHDYIHPYRGRYGAGADVNRFFPSLGNHDWRTSSLRPYLSYFTLPGNERYYEVQWGAVHLFAVDSDQSEPDGDGPSSKQAQWLATQMRGSTAPWKLVYMHEPPYSSSLHGQEPESDWPFHELGAALVLSGHDHVYERIERDGNTFIVNGLGGHPLQYGFGTPVDGSIVRFNERHGAMLVIADRETLEFRFVTVEGDTVDAMRLRKRDGGIEKEALPHDEDGHDGGAPCPPRSKIG